VVVRALEIKTFTSSTFSERTEEILSNNPVEQKYLITSVISWLWLIGPLSHRKRLAILMRPSIWDNYISQYEQLNHSLLQFLNSQIDLFSIKTNPFTFRTQKMSPVALNTFGEFL
jgi:hypothetical protein